MTRTSKNKGASYFRFDKWFIFMDKHPSTYFILLILVISMMVGYIFFIVYQEKNKYERTKLPTNMDFREQILSLNNTEKSLKDLLKFVESQKSILQRTEETLGILKKERKELEPLVELDKNIVENILRVQENRSKKSKWKDLFVGFALGVLSSILSHIIVFLFGRKKKILKQHFEK